MTTRYQNEQSANETRYEIAWWRTRRNNLPCIGQRKCTLNTGYHAELPAIIEITGRNKRVIATRIYPIIAAQCCYVSELVQRWISKPHLMETNGIETRARLIKIAPLFPRNRKIRGTVIKIENKVTPDDEIRKSRGIPRVPEAVSLRARRDVEFALSRSLNAVSYASSFFLSSPCFKQ